jgi:hypothetical protein
MASNCPLIPSPHCFKDGQEPKNKRLIRREKPKKGRKTRNERKGQYPAFRQMTQTAGKDKVDIIKLYLRSTISYLPRGVIVTAPQTSLPRP